MMRLGFVMAALLIIEGISGSKVEEGLSGNNSGINMTTSSWNNEFKALKSEYFGLTTENEPTVLYSLQLSNTCRGSIFTTPVTVGGQTFNVIADTGSRHLWVCDTKLDRTKGGVEPSRSSKRGGNACLKKHFYDKKRSYSYSPVYDTYGGHQQFIKSYANSVRVRGLGGLETMNIGGVVVEEVPFAAVTYIRGKGNNIKSLLYGMDGVMGLGPKPVSNSPSTSISVFEKMYRDQTVENEIISFHITSEQSGTLILGGIDYDLFSGSLQYMKVVSQEPSSKWMVGACGMKYGGYGLADDLVPGAKFNFDSGSPRLRVPSPVYYDLVERIPGIKLRKGKEKGERATIRCDLLSTLEKLEIEFTNPIIYDGDDNDRRAAEVPFIIGGKRETACAKNPFCCWGPQQKTPRTVISFSPHEYFEKDPVKEGQCYLLVRPGSADTWRIGINPFFRKYYVAFDYSKRTIGFAPSVVREQV